MKKLVAWLRVETPAPARLTPWAWTADVILAVLLAIGAVNGAAEPYQVPDRHGPMVVHGPFDRGAPPVRPPKPELPPIPDDPGRMAPAPDDGGEAGWLLLAAALTALPLAFRRRFPLVSFLVIVACTFAVFQENADPTWTVVASLIAAYSAPMYSRYRNLALVSVVVTTAIAVSDLQDNLPDLPQGLMLFLILSSVGLAANTIHSWRQRARTAEREQAAAARIAVDEERARLARELHDVVTHNVSVMVVQAGAARKVMDARPEQAKEALLAVEAGGRAALTELRQAIGLLTVGEDHADLAPQPGLDQLETLVERVRETGVPVTLAVAAPPVPPGIGLAAYRVVQEALTNAVKHAAGAAIDVVVSADGRTLHIDVADTGGVAALGAHGSGRGLAGLRERLTVYGGTLTAGPRPTGGFRVQAEIPLEVGAA
ncbi:two-component sensor histidine kinase [Dactylosporangium vinaceum]|uniref:histidine kinase n=1 Tax=Dactylosporangium vinaceum TaxID=53362 RepID=A0ABV5MBY1_9ACTN|nr:histidine kinase [Dactylosporangium vinaceum]UAC01336.1 two-component sensor histidine kinase [Dactylosporangium vinaceum]